MSVVAGVELVTIPVTEYAALLDCRRQLAEHKAKERAFNTPSKSPIERDAEVAAFLADLFGRAAVRLIRDDCARQFGAARTPSKSAIYRYWARLRG